MFTYQLTLGNDKEFREDITLSQTQRRSRVEQLANLLQTFQNQPQTPLRVWEQRQRARLTNITY